MSSVDESNVSARVLYVGNGGWADTRAGVESVDDRATLLDRIPEADCVVYECHTSENDSLDTLDAVHELDSDLPFLLVTDDEQTIHDALTAGATDCVQPGSDVLLGHRVETAIERYRNERERNWRYRDERHQNERYRNGREQSATETHPELPDDFEPELEASDERYRKLIETSPEAILVADTETGRILDANPAAETLLGRSRDEILDMHHSEIHPEEKRASYRDLFDSRVEQGGDWKSPGSLTILRDDGEDVPVEVSSTVIQLGGRQVMYAIFQDISERTVRERTLDSLRSATRELMAAETKVEICEIATRVARATLGLPLSGIYLADDDGHTLRPVAVTKETDEIPTLEAGTALAWSVFESGETAVFEDVKNEHGAYNQETPVEKEMIFPLGDHGVLMVGSPSETDLGEYLIDFTETLATNVQTALDRAEREEMLSAQRTELAELNRINEVIRNVDRTLVRATSRKEIERSVPERLAATGTYRFAWLGEYDTASETVHPISNAGEGDGYLESVIDPAADARDPATNALETGEITVIEDIETEPAFGPWRAESLDRGYRSLAAIPIQYDETQYGVLVVHADRTSAFDDRERAVLAELGETIGLAITAIESKKALLSDCIVEIEIELQGSDHFFMRIPRETGCEFTLQGTTLSTDGSLLCFVTVSGASTEEILELAYRDETITDARVIHDFDDESLVEFTYNGRSLIKMLADRGATVAHAKADENGSRTLIELPRDANVRQMIDSIRDSFGSVSVVAQRERDRPEPTISGFRAMVSESLTECQWVALETAYLAGFYDWPRGSTGEEVAALLDVSPPTFHQHIRRAQSILLDAFFDR